MPTVLNVITRSMRAVKTLGGTEVPSAADATNAMEVFNTMLDSWNGEGLTNYQVREQSHVLVVGTSQYTIGSGGTINTTRPIDIVQAYIQDSSDFRYLMKIVPRDKWNQIGQLTVTSQIPSTLFYDPQFPLGVINLFPEPLQAWTLFFDSLLQQVTYSSSAQSISMPPGYERAFVMNLAVELMGAGYPSMLKPEELTALVANALAAKANIKRNNLLTREVIANYDDAIVAHSYASYNIYRDFGGGRG